MGRDVWLEGERAKLIKRTSIGASCHALQMEAKWGADKLTLASGSTFARTRKVEMKFTSAWWPRLALVLTLLVCWGGIFWNYAEMGKLFDRFNAYYRPLDQLQQPFKPYLKNDIPQLFWDDDTYQRLMLLKEMDQAGAWRWHWTKIDNYPEGRVVYWSGPYMWYVMGLAYPAAWFQGISFEKALEFVAPWANPLLQGTMQLAFALVLPRFLGVGLTIGFLVLATTLPGLCLYDYKAYQCDHQSLHSLSFLSSLICLIVAGVGRRQEQELSWKVQSTLFIVGGILLSFGLWVGAARQTVIWFIIGIGLVSSLLLRANSHGAGTIMAPHPRLWSLWGRAAGLTSLAGYLIEYFPGYISVTTLEVNTPLHALTLFCAGELLALITRLRHEPASVNGRHLIESFFLLCGVSILPLCTVFGPVDWVMMRNSDLAQMALRIEESQPAIRAQSGQLFLQLWSWFGLLIFLPFLGLALFFHRRVDQIAKARLMVTLVTIGAIVPLFLFHMRSWSYFLNAALLCHFLSVGLAVRSLSWPKWTWFVFAILIVLQGSFFQKTTLETAWQLTQGRSNAPELLEAAIQRELGLYLQKTLPGQKPVYMAASMLGVRLAHFGQGGVMGSQYENAKGVKASIDFFSDTGALDTAKMIAQERGVTHVVVNVCQAFLDTTVRAPAVRLPGEEGLTLGERLCLPKPLVPDWLQPIPSLPYLFQGYALDLRLYRVDRSRLGMKFTANE